MSVMPPVYLDYNATTPVDPRVLEMMLPFFSQRFGNAASPHGFGCSASSAVELAREQVASLIAADPREIVFTSGATESNNLAIKGVAEFYKDKGRHIITAVHEHHAVLDPCRKLASRGYEVTAIRPRPDSGGVIDAQQIKEAIRPDTILVSIMWANNEVGTINDIAAIGALCHQRSIIFHTDATQALGKIEVDVEATNIDLLSGSAHKFYGPKGAGFLHVRRKGPRVRLDAQFDGGGHERTMRSGTLNVPGIVGLGAAAKICQHEMKNDEAMMREMRELRDHLEASLLAAIEGSHINGHRDKRLPQTLNLSLPGVESDRLIASMNDLAISAGAACTSASREVSHVLSALGLSEESARGAMRLSLGRFTTRAEIDWAIARIIQAVQAQTEQTDETCHV